MTTSKRVPEIGPSRAPRPIRPQQRPETPPTPLELLQARNSASMARVIGSILISHGGVLADVRASIKPSHCWVELHRTIYAAMCALDDRGAPVSLDTVTDELQRLGHTEAATGLAAFTYETPTDDEAVYLAQIVAETSTCIRFMDVLTVEIAKAAVTQDMTLPAKFDYIEGLIADERARTTSAEGDLLPHPSIGELMDAEPPQGILGNILYEQQDHFLCGPSGSWKSFVAVDMGLCLVTGESWLGRAVRLTGDVVYVAAEGGAGIGKRVRAWCQQHGVPESEIERRFHPICTQVNLLHEEEVTRLIRTIAALVEDRPVVAIMMDTLSRCTAGGDMNSEQDASVAMTAIQRLRETFACATLVVAHPGKDTERGIRGSSVFGQWVDNSIRIERETNAQKPNLDPGEVIRVVSDKAKEDVRFEPIRLTAKPVAWSRERDGVTFGSLVMVSADGIAKPDATRTSTRRKPSVAERLCALMKTHHPGGATFGTLLKLFMEQTEYSKSSFQRALDELEATRRVENISGFYKLISSDDENEDDV